MQDKTIQETQSAFIQTICNMVSSHPYFCQKPHHLQHHLDGTTFRILGCYEDGGSIDNVVFAAYFRPRCGEYRETYTDPGRYSFALLVSAIDEYPEKGGGSFDLTLALMDRGDNRDIDRVIETFRVCEFHSTVLAVIAMFMTLCPELAVAAKYSLHSRKVPTQWRKALFRAVTRYATQAPFRKWHPEHIPPGSVVELGGGVSRAGQHVTVQSVVTIEPNSYVLQTDEYSRIGSNPYRLCFNLGYVARVVTRGTGEVARPTTARSLLHDLRGSGPTHATLIPCQREAERVLFSDVERQGTQWAVPGNAHAFVLKYVLTYLPAHRISHNLEYQLDTYRLLNEVSTHARCQSCPDGNPFGRVTWITRIDVKKFRKAVKRIHCYLRPLAQAVADAELYSEDLD